MKDPLLDRRFPLATATRRSPLALWHLLSLDAPTVATVWSWFIAHCAGMRLSRASLTSMFLAVWLLYAADRLLDARVVQVAMSPHVGTPHHQVSIKPSDLELRHYFHHQHRRAFLTGIAISGVLLATLLSFLPTAALRLYTILGALLITWFLVIHARLAASTRLPKEFAVGVFFSAAVFIPTVAAHPELRIILLGPALLFAGLCTLNCIFLHAWEHPATGGTTHWTHWTTRLALKGLRPLAWALVLASLTLCGTLNERWAQAIAHPAIHVAQFAPLALACLLSAALLLLLDRYRRHLSAVHVRAAADFALLTPILWLLLGRKA